MSRGRRASMSGGTRRTHRNGEGDPGGSLHFPDDPLSDLTRGRRRQESDSERLISVFQGKGGKVLRRASPPPHPACGRLLPPAGSGNCHRCVCQSGRWTGCRRGEQGPPAGERPFATNVTRRQTSPCGKRHCAGNVTVRVMPGFGAGGRGGRRSDRPPKKPGAP